MAGDRDADAALTQNRTTFPGAQVLDCLGDGILATDADLDAPGGPRIVYADAAFAEITGYGVDELVGQSPAILQGPTPMAL